MDFSSIRNYIEKQDTKVVQSLDLTALKVKYQGVTVCTNRKKEGPEEIARAYLLTKLVNELGYKPDHIELEHKYTAGRPDTNKSYSDVVVRDDDGNVFLFFDTKTPEPRRPEDTVSIDNDKTIEEQLFKVAGMERTDGHSVKYLVLYTISVNHSTGAINDKCVIIDNEKYKTFDCWKVNRDFTNTLPARYGKAVKAPYIRGSSKDLEKNYSSDTLNQLRKNLHNVLWGGGGTDDNEVFSSLTNLILAKIYDEDHTVEGAEYSFQSFAYEDERGNIEYEKNETLFERINDLYKHALEDKLFIRDKNELERLNVVTPAKFSLSKLKCAVEELECFSFHDGGNTLNGRDILGDFFEGIIRDGFKQTKGQFFTHVYIVRFMLYGIQADRLAVSRINTEDNIPYMVDPSAGSGTFLIEYMKFITEYIKHRNLNELGYNRALQNTNDMQEKVAEWFPNHRENTWARTYIYGCEINFNLGTATKVNMILHGDGASNIFVKDGLLPFINYEKTKGLSALKHIRTDDLYAGKDVNEQFDLILTNPPFSVDLDNDTRRTLGSGFLFSDRQNSENLFIERWYQLLRENGRLAAILPDSIFDTSESEYMRLFLYKYFNIKAIISLPKTAFQPYTSTKTSILFAQKKKREDVKKWNDAWADASSKYSKLRTRVTNLIDVHDGRNVRSKLPSIRDLTPEQEVEILKKMLGSYLCENDGSLSSDELIVKYRDELEKICTIEDIDMRDYYGHVNVWWVFGEVARSLNYDIFMAEADYIGYKRTKRKEKSIENELYRVDSNGEIIVDDGVETTILDYMRKISWD